LIRPAVAVCLSSAALGLAACGSGEEPAAGGRTQPAAAASAGGDGYKPVSDVAPHAAIGKDVAAIRAALEAKDFAGAEAVWKDGANSRKDDGSARTLAGFVEESPVGRLVVQALEGNGAAADLSPDQRRQWVDKGMVVALEAKVLDEVDTAIEKAKAGETEPAEGAPHNIDEAWAFFTAGGEGVAATAAKREADFEGVEIEGPAIAALAGAQRAAGAGDVAALESAREALRGALNRVFALAVTKYANEAVEDDVAAAEGAAFAWGLRDDLPAAALERVEAAFETPGYRRAQAVRATLNEHVEELGIGQEVPAFEG